MLDTVGNTVLFSEDPSTRLNSICVLGVVITVTCQFGFLSMLFIRMYRVQAVAYATQNYLT